MLYSPIAERDFDNLLECLKISSSYMLLGRDSFMAVHANDVVGILTGCVGQVKEQGLVAMAETAVLLLQVRRAALHSYTQLHTNYGRYGCVYR